MRDSIARVAELTDEDRAALTALSRIVYPPEEWADWPGRELEWTEAEWCVRLFEGDRLASYIGIVVRDGGVDGHPMRIGGVGGIKTHPASRGRGHARRGLNIALDFFREQPEVTFALLVCEPHLLPYYAGLGWQEFEGKLLVRQFGAVAEFTFNRVMTHPVRTAGPRTGVIDLCGPAW